MLLYIRDSGQQWYVFTLSSDSSRRDSHVPNLLTYVFWLLYVRDGFGLLFVTGTNARNSYNTPYPHMSTQQQQFAAEPHSGVGLLLYVLVQHTVYSTSLYSSSIGMVVNSIAIRIHAQVKLRLGTNPLHTRATAVLPTQRVHYSTVQQCSRTL